MRRPIEIIDMPTSAGSNGAGIEQAPGAMREAGLVKALQMHGIEIVDRNDAPPPWVWRAEPGNVTASNTQAVIDYVRHTETRVRRSYADSNLPLVLGGDCTIQIGVISALRRFNGRTGLIYFDSHTDLNVPGAVPEGTGEFVESLDWMGVAHMLDLDGVVSDLAGAGVQRPLLQPRDIAVFGFVSEQASVFEHHQINRLGLTVVDWQRVANAPQEEATRLIESWVTEFDRVAVHFDVDVLNFPDTPIADTSASQQVGLTLEQALAALTIFVADPRIATLTIAEINPIRCQDNSSFLEALARFVKMISITINHDR